MAALCIANIFFDLPRVPTLIGKALNKNCQRKVFFGRIARNTGSYQISGLVVSTKLTGLHMVQAELNIGVVINGPATVYAAMTVRGINLSPFLWPNPLAALSCFPACHLSFSLLTSINMSLFWWHVNKKETYRERKIRADLQL
jgi:hypothetical protein